jgi:Permeases of the drug/metabolite transporter (DMT) superfamily
MAYLVAIGSIVGYTAFGYALENGSAAVVGTYAYVNPVVAVLLGWLVLHEPITGRMLAAMALILGSVLWIQLAARPDSQDSRSGRSVRSSGAGQRTRHDDTRRYGRPILDHGGRGV